MSTNNSKLSVFVVVAYIIAVFAMMFVPFPQASAASAGHMGVRVERMFVSTGSPLYVPSDDRKLPEGEFPTMCFDPLLTNTLILDIDGCGKGAPASSTPVVKKQKDAPVTVVATSTPAPVVIIISTDAPVVVTPEPTEDGKLHCNKGEGNGGEGCDPGNHPERGNNDED